jgi:hypothetical protein
MRPHALHSIQAIRTAGRPVSSIPATVGPGMAVWRAGYLADSRRNSRLSPLVAASHNLSMDKLSAAGVVEEFLTQWNSSDLPDKMPEPMLIDNGPQVELNAIGVYGPHQHLGYASRALRMLTPLCDENGVAITLIARPLPPDLSRRLVRTAWIRRCHGSGRRHSRDGS